MKRATRYQRNGRVQRPSGAAIARAGREVVSARAPVKAASQVASAKMNVGIVNEGPAPMPLNNPLCPPVILRSDGSLAIHPDFI
jgi:hypothetical protein